MTPVSAYLFLGTYVDTVPSLSPPVKRGRTILTDMRRIRYADEDEDETIKKLPVVINPQPNESCRS